MRQDNAIIKADVLATDRDASGEIRINIGESTDGSGLASSAALWCADGFFGVPVEPDADGACSVLYQVEGNQRRAIASKDNRFVDAYGQMAPGDRAIVSDCKARWLMKRESDSITVYTQDANDDPLVLSVDGSQGAIIAQVGGAGGTATLEMKSGEVKISAGGTACIQIKGNEIYIFGDLFWAATGRVVLGQVGGAPPPIGASSALYGVSGVLGAPSSSVTIAP
jgi:hypothetical protein